MTVLLLGATGFMGPYVARALEARGCEVVSVSRGGGGRAGVAADRQDVAGLRALIRELRTTSVIDLLAYTEANTLPLWDGLEGEVERWVMASSCDVYRNYEGLHRKADPPPIIGPFAEDSPLRTRLYPYRTEPRRPADAADAWMDDYDKIPLEVALLARPSLGGVIMRLPMVFGPGDRQRRFRWLIRPMLAHAVSLTVDPSWAVWRTTYGYAADVADALATAALHPVAAGRIFNLGRSEIGDHRDWIARFAAALGWRGKVVEAPAMPDSPVAALNLSYPLWVDSRAFREACDWHEPTLLEEALGQTIADERARD
ncbi:MAG TPA: NAD-dependent epimerase/dehydratase family protein [Caulobacteraceae bacterium]|jgi:nucleoside-diphosphate-sugar epimerase|nr:NAD-dependent epimerase/dehydratase family protein [Caulobacteraceae bacterium]